MTSEEQIMENLRRCPSFDRCSQNLCPLDLELHLRTGNESSKCRWMREAKKTRIEDKEFVSGGQVMPDAILNLVPESNLKWLNGSSQERWYGLKKFLRTNRWFKNVGLTEKGVAGATPLPTGGERI